MLRLIATLLGTTMMVLGAIACSGPEPRPAEDEVTLTAGSPAASAGHIGASAGDIIDLPAPRTDGGMSLEEALAARRSAREFTDEPLTLEQISQLLWSAQGITADWGGRTAPSAGALYPLEVYVVTADGSFHYLPDGHRLWVMSRGDLRAPLAEAALGQAAVSEAPAVFVITAVYARTAGKYGDRAERYVRLEAGHACQNLLLQAVALGLGAVPIGAFSDTEVQRVLGLPADQEPLYLIPVGHPVPE